MLKKKEQTISFENVRRYIETLGGCADSYQGKFNVIVGENAQYVYKNIEISTTYEYSTSDYRVSIMWEEDSDAIDYKDINLHGRYSSNFQLFCFENGELTFKDGGFKIAISKSFR